MSDDTRAWIQEYLGKVAAQDVEAANAYYADDLVFHLLGQSQLAGDYDKDGFHSVLAEYFADRDVTIEPLDVLVSDDHAAAVVRNTVDSSKGAHTGLRVVLYRIGDGKIHEVWTFDEDQRAYDAAVDNP